MVRFASKCLQLSTLRSYDCTAPPSNDEGGSESPASAELQRGILRRLTRITTGAHKHVLVVELIVELIVDLGEQAAAQLPSDLVSQRSLSGRCRLCPAP